MKIIPVFLHYDYGIKERGETIEYAGGGWFAALKQLGHDVYPFWWDDYIFDKEKLQKQLIGYADSIKPDIILFILMRDEFTFETLDYLKERYITINWFWDDQWRFESFTRYYAPHFTYCITTDKFAISKYKLIGYQNVIFSSPACHDYATNIDFEKVEYKYDVSFVGQNSTYRRWVIKQLRKRGIDVVCFGYGWPRGPISYEEMTEIFRTSKINLNISNSISYDIRFIFSNYKNFKTFLKSKKRVEQIKQRNFEIPAFGGFQLTNYVPSLEDHFEIGKEIAIYTGIDDLLLQIIYYLENEEARKKIAIAGYKKVLSLGPTYVHRFKDIFSRIGK
ncbi:MAG: glycosyltransferase [Candidatus Omnitrophica bacterium]|nr:glycosyltransferase [Candidatus Omnitrophota bacterium]MCM8816246.1 glycosyltransferase [Candidatus Omnitrophota bacterium]